ncbi:hypothetical protein APUTEX25_002562 [Auxenochlorella protothecoides]|uniref:Protease Do-like PDZ domain-containing protein n=3 Tax=Auxenochlorella protothecoides TaxID=3075 RepID=A0A1D2AH64_AUXPR|nr:hypothetical protein APUTEX25_002562 [Auxenochlorella protothecoides]|eukprot:RMZ53985.1 hypothetical protein APUTEX25_002562 [Auxenochlorella protothecoides]
MSSSIPCSEKAYPLRGKPPSPPRMDLRCSAFSAPGAQGGPREEAGTGPVPSARHLHSLDSSTDLIQDHHLVLDPATPATAKHHAAEAELTTGAGARVLKRHMDAVLKVFATHSYPNHELPWQRKQQTHSKSTGFAVAFPGGQRWILTNAHSVSYATQVQLKRRGDDEKHAARVLAVGTGCDVALLTVDDEAFWRDLHPVELSADTPALQAAVAVLGYPIGGDSLAISAGVVSRVQMTHYSHGCMSLLAVQTDAAINSGNSGGPVMSAQGGECVGIAFQSLTGNTANIGYVIPTLVVRHFLHDYMRTGTYTGFPSLNVVWQELESRTLRLACGMGPQHKGVLVRSVSAAAHEAEVLRQDDVIMAINGVEVGNDGTVPFRHGERVDLKYAVTSRFVGDTVTLSLLRARAELAVAVRLSPYQYLVPPHMDEGRPPYLLVGGLVFTALSDPFLAQRYGSVAAAPVRLLHRSFLGVRARAGEQTVVLSTVLACPATLGYEGAGGLRDSPLVAFNGTPVDCLAQLASLVAACNEPSMRFDMEAGGKMIILDSAVARACTAGVMEDHGISATMSPDIAAAVERAQRAQHDAFDGGEQRPCRSGVAAEHCAGPAPILVPAAGEPGEGTDGKPPAASG